MIQKMRRTQHGPIPAHGNHQVHIGQMLPVQFDTIDARVFDVILTQDRE